MSRREMIIISVLVNAGLLTVLFITAIKSDPETTSTDVEMQQVASADLNPPAKPSQEILTTIDGSLDEVDNVLKEYLPDLPPASYAQETPVSVPLAKEEQVSVPAQTPPASPETFVDVVVKPGDALEKIARANRTTIEAIKKANNLSNDRLKVGQVLKVPVGAVKPKDAEASKQSLPKTTGALAAGGDGPVYYTIKTGDNPWKIAKTHQVKFEDLLRMNNLDQESAKNLKVGDKIRVK